MPKTKRRADAVVAKVHYDASTEQVVVRCANGAGFHVPIAEFPAVADAKPAERGGVTISTDGTGIRWDLFDVDYYWPYLLAVLLGEDAWRRAATSAVGSIKSPAKARASRANGAKGGRPRKRQLAGR